jgi:hypothetical protein
MRPSQGIGRAGVPHPPAYTVRDRSQSIDDECTDSLSRQEISWPRRARGDAS